MTNAVSGVPGVGRRDGGINDIAFSLVLLGFVFDLGLMITLFIVYSLNVSMARWLTLPMLTHQTETKLPI